LRIASAFIVGVAIAFLAWYGWHYAANLPDLKWDQTTFWLHFALALLLYAAAITVSAVNWRWLLLGFGARPRPLVAEAIVLMTQIAKYLPGNVGHFVGRIAIAKLRGISLTAAGASLLCEQLLAISSAVLFVALGYFIAPNELKPIVGYLPGLPLLAVLLLGAGLSPLFFGSIAFRINRLIPERLKPALAQVSNLGVLRAVRFIAAQCLAFVCVGLAVVSVADAVSGAAALNGTVAAVVFAAAWIAGLVTPGAPGGMGVRETIMVVGFAPFVGEGTALTIALAMRLVSVMGDGVVFLIGYAVDRLIQRRDPQPAR
jgi:uncharacterized membrane protein YbhN (UPF0104 family)